MMVQQIVGMTNLRPLRLASLRSVADGIATTFGTKGL
jgi:hypothetical protein